VITQRCNRSALRCFGHDVPDHEAARCTGETSIRDERHGLAEPRSLQCTCHELHLTHTRPAARSLVAQDHYVVGLDAAALYRLERILFALEHARRAAMDGFLRCN